MPHRRPPLATLLALAALPVLSGCTLLQGIAEAASGPATSAPPLGIGSCLDGMIGADSDRDATVPCDDPHLFEVTAIEEWPGLDDALTAADGDAGRVWDDIHDASGEGPSAGYAQWASRACNEAGQRMVGIAQVEVDGTTAAEMWLRVAGPYNVDLSLASRAAFADGDHRTVCSLAWYGTGQTPRRVAGPGFADLLGPGFGPEQRECWDSSYYEVGCARPHAIQALLGFEGLVVFGEDLITRAAEREITTEDWDTIDDFCEELLYQALPPTASLDGLGYLGETGASEGWDAYDGTVDPDGAYWFACLASGLEPGDLISGDVFDGDAAIDGPSNSGA